MAIALAFGIAAVDRLAIATTPRKRTTPANAGTPDILRTASAMSSPVGHRQPKILAQLPQAPLDLRRDVPAHVEHRPTLSTLSPSVLTPRPLALMLAREESPVQLPALLFRPQAEDAPGDDLGLLHPAMGPPTQHHDIGQHIVPLRAACDVMHLAAPALATVQQFAQFARKHVLGVLAQQSLVTNRHHFFS
jgi:hypothetical protein